MTRSARSTFGRMALVGVLIHLLLWVFGWVVRHEVGGVDGPPVEPAMAAGEALTALGIVAAVLIGVHLILWVEVRRTDLDEADDPRLVWLDGLVILSGIAAVWIGVAGLAPITDGGTVTGGRLGAAVTALLVTGMAADAAVAVKAEVLQRAEARVRRERREVLRALVERLGTEGPPPSGAGLRLTAGIVAAGVAGGVAALVADRPPSDALVDGLAVALGALFVLGTVVGGAHLWWDRREWSNLVMGPTLAMLLVSGLALCLVPAARAGSDGVDLGIGLLAGFIGPLCGGVLSVRRRTGSARALVAAWLRHRLDRLGDDRGATSAA